MKITCKVNRRALIIALVSFILGSTLFVSYLLLGSFKLIYFGFIHTMIATVINGIALVEIIGNAIINRHHFKENLITITLVLLNVPIVIGYIALLF